MKINLIIHPKCFPLTLVELCFPSPVGLRQHFLCSRVVTDNVQSTMINQYLNDNFKIEGFLTSVVIIQGLVVKFTKD